jgi:L-alanine-DL-glutamate epimerase-like enolase superfamily enzyme
MLKNYGITWFEDPLFSDSICELKKFSQKINIPVCVGENYHSEWQFEDVCELGAADILQPDVVRCGGITSFLKIVTVAEQYNKKLLTHLLPELSVSLIGLCKTAYACEMIGLFPAETFTQEFSVVDGNIKIPLVPGTGAYISPHILKKFRI